MDIRDTNNELSKDVKADLLTLIDTILLSKPTQAIFTLTYRARVKKTRPTTPNTNQHKNIQSPVPPSPVEIQNCQLPAGKMIDRACGSVSQHAWASADALNAADE